MRFRKSFLTLVVLLTVSALARTGYGAEKGSQAAPDATTSSASGTIAILPNSASDPPMINSMDPKASKYSYLQIANGLITSFDKSAVNPATIITLPAGAVVYPGFIDSHSHAISMMTPTMKDLEGNPFWINLASVNVMLQPACPKGQQSTTTCFTPIKTQGMVDSLIKSASKNAAGWVAGWNYEPARLSCKVNGVAAYGFSCKNFENQSKKPVRKQLDELQPNLPVLITSESGHIAYVNSAALSELNICPEMALQPPPKSSSKSAAPSCYRPTVNPEEETKLARTGQLDEDVAIYALTYLEGKMAAAKPTLYFDEIDSATAMYSQLGFTTVQEGAASSGLIQAYIDRVEGIKGFPGKTLPVRMAFLEYDDMPANEYAKSVDLAKGMRKLLAEKNLDMFIAGMKAFADGSNQGFTGAMSAPTTYSNLNPPFTDTKIFPQQPYLGLPDYDQQGLTTAIQAAHAAHFPLWVHSNGTVAQTNVLTVMEQNLSGGMRDIVLHFTTPTQQQVASIPKQNIGVTFLMNDYYYYYQPLCEQVVGPDPSQTANLYPARWAEDSHLHYSLHSDTSVTPPSPLFSMWVATTRDYQRPHWLPQLSAGCAAAVKTNQRISRLQAMRAYTTEAAWLYRRDRPIDGQTAIGSLQLGYAGDAVVLSADPLAKGTDLSTIKVLYTIHNGKVVYSDPNGSNPVIWPN